MVKYDYHIIVVGAGSAGLVVASGAAGLGAKVALIESHKMGGDCLNYGCIPSKTFLKSARIASLIQHSDTYGIDSKIQSIDLKKVMKRVRSIIQEIEPHDSKARYEGLGVSVFESALMGYGIGVIMLVLVVRLVGKDPEVIATQSPAPEISRSS